MQPSSRTPEGEPSFCPVCGKDVCIEPTRPPGDAPCPHCGTLLWFPGQPAPQLTTAWDYGLQMLKAGDAAAGLALLQNVVAHQPDDLAKRQTLREMERTIRSGTAADESVAWVEMAESRWEIVQAKRKRDDAMIDWDTIDKAAERGLAVDPWDVDLHLELGHACRARGYTDVAQYAYRCAFELAPDRPDIKAYLTHD
jgi:hypothetical protein